MARAIVHAVLDNGCQLLPTLQTWVGMVQYGGRARVRAPAKDESFFKELEARILEDAAHLLKRLPYKCSELDMHKREILVQNMWACTAQSRVTSTTLIEYIKHEKRLDVEQAVGMVLAFVPKEVSTMLAPLVADMFVSTNMWREPADFEVVDSRSLAAARGRKLARLRDEAVAMAEARASAESIDDKLLVRVLMRVRRERSALSCSQRLRFPKYLMALLPEKERATWTESYTWGWQSEVMIEPDSVIRVTKRRFVRIQRWLLRLDGNMSERSVFIREVAKLEKEVRHGRGQSDPLENTRDPAALAYSFMAVQRRLQLKVVSDRGWTEFLKKGQGSAVLQNRPDIVTSFEQELARHATDLQALLCVRPSKALLAEHSTGMEELIPQVDQVCTMMEQYVLLFGHGRFENLRFLRVREDGWKGRGPEDVYNLLVDLLAVLRTRGNGLVTIGPCNKFLAKDIMAWNKAWKDDAFAPGKIPGWVEWLMARQKLRIHLNTADADASKGIAITSPEIET